MPNTLSVREAQERILSILKPVEQELAGIEQASGRVLSTGIVAPGDMPQFDNSSMDGFAVRAEDVVGATMNTPVRLAIIEDIPAGAAPEKTVQPGQAARIMTGAQMPQGADAVVPVEDTDFAPTSTGAGQGGMHPSLPDRIEIYRSVRAGAHVRARGSDIAAGEHLLRAGRELYPQDVGLIASIGLAQVPVYRRPRVALFSSGDELVPPGRPLTEGKIYDSNQYVLAALLEREGAEVIRLGTAPDEPGQIEARLSQAAARGADLIVTSAGVSVGAFDFVRQVIETHGSLDFWKVNMRPGKPLAFGSYDGIPLIGLPGNPVSAFVGCRVFAIPAVYRLSGREGHFPHLQTAVLAENVESDGRESYLRAIVTFDGGRPTARLTGHQGSGNLHSLVLANALLIVPSGVKSLPSGSEVKIWYLEGE